MKNGVYGSSEWGKKAIESAINVYFQSIYDDEIGKIMKLETIAYRRLNGSLASQTRQSEMCCYMHKKPNTFIKVDANESFLLKFEATVAASTSPAEPINRL